jgi:peptide/nickel transport system permease protein
MTSQDAHGLELSAPVATRTAAAPTPEPDRSYRSARQILVRQFVRNRGAIDGLAIIGFFILMTLIGPFLTPYDPLDQDLSSAFLPRTLAHPLGTDELGRDTLTRLLYGSRITLLITLGAVAISLVLGGGLGLVAGFYGGKVDNLSMRAIDILMAMPGFLLAIAVIAALGVGTVNLIIAVAAVSLPSFARFARASTLAVRNQEYILAARASGAGATRLMLSHILPNITAPLIVQTSLRMATAILTASGLSFLGLGPAPPTPEWGAMLNTGRKFITSHAELATYPGLAILFVTIGFNLLGDGLRDALDPRLRR